MAQRQNWIVKEPEPIQESLSRISQKNAYSNDKKAGTAKATVKFTSFGTVYQFERYYKINTINIDARIHINEYNPNYYFTTNDKNMNIFSKKIQTTQNSKKN